MKIRSTLELQDSLDQDLHWRKKEFTTLKLMISSSRKHEKYILQKSAIVLLYSHWEGHIKHCSLAYLNYLNNIGCCVDKMKDNFILIGLYEKFNKGFSFKRLDDLVRLNEYLSNTQKGNFKVKEDKIIDTDSNLKYPVLLNILHQLGLDISPYELREQFINSTLVGHRNYIAHGERLDPVVIDAAYNEIEQELLNMVMYFQTLILNAVTTKEYLKSAS